MASTFIFLTLLAVLLQSGHFIYILLSQWKPAFFGKTLWSPSTTFLVFLSTYTGLFYILEKDSDQKVLLYSLVFINIWGYGILLQ